MTFATLARALSGLAWFCIGLLAIGWIFLVTQAIAWPDLLTPDVPPALAGMKVTPLALAAARAVSLLTLLPAIFALVHVARLLADFARGAVLTERSARHIRWIGAAIAVRALLGAPAQTLSSALLTLPNPPGQRLLSIGFSSDGIEMLLYGGLLFAIGAAMRQAARAAAENAEFV